MNLFKKYFFFKLPEVISDDLIDFVRSDYNPNTIILMALITTSCRVKMTFNQQQNRIKDF